MRQKSKDGRKLTNGDWMDKTAIAMWLKWLSLLSVLLLTETIKIHLNLKEKISNEISQPNVSSFNVGCLKTNESRCNVC